MIYQKGLSLPPEIKKKLEQRAETQDEKVLLFFWGKKESYPVHLVQRETGIKRENSVARSMNTLSNEDREINKYVDRYGNAPLIKTPETCWNADRSAKVHKWKWNPNYNRPKQAKEGETLSMFEERCVV